MKLGLDLCALNAQRARSQGFSGTSNSTSAVSSQKVFDINDFRPKSCSRALSFTGNLSKNLDQVASIAPEYQGILNQIYKVGGLGNVSGEAAVAFHDHGGADIRTFIPYYAPENASGGIKIKAPLVVDGVQQKWQVPVFDKLGKAVKEAGEQLFEERPAFEFRSVPADYILKEGEEFVIHEPVVKGKEWNTGYKVLKDTGLSGFIESIDDKLAGLKKIPYRMFQVEGTDKALKGNPPVYVMHTPDLAKFSKAYNAAKTGAYGGGSFDDLLYANFSKSVVDALPKMDTDKFGHYNPGSFWLHDRQAFPSLLEISEKSAHGDDYWKGIRAHSSFHNPGRGYQGHYKNPIDFLRIVGSPEDFESLKNSPDYPFVKQMVDKIDSVRSLGEKFSPEDILSADEMKKLNEIFKPMFGEFVDEYGEYNLCNIPVQAVKKNPFNMSAGTVSTTYGREMRNHNTKEIAKGLTSQFASIPTVDIVNGSTPANLHLDVIGDFGKNNGFTSEIKKGFTPLTKEVMENADLLYDAKQSNKKWFIDTVAKATEGGPQSLAKLFFSDDAIDKGASVLGGFSKYKKGDVLFFSWGRPDTQKGFPTTVEGFLQFLKDDSVEPAMKEKTKFLIGAGPWPDDSADWKNIKSLIEQIGTLEDGKYKGNICYANGFFTNRVVACADFANITSRYEPCGITPLEAFSAGTPVISNKTGGSPDFIKPFVKGQDIGKSTGFLTRHAFYVNPEVIGADPSLTGQALDDARRVALGRENAQCIKDAVEMATSEPSSYKKMMMNSAQLPIDWHNNDAFNGGKSALRRYFEDVWHLGENFSQVDGLERNATPLVNLKGKMAAQAYQAVADDKPVVEQAAQAVEGSVKEAVSVVKKTLSKNAKIGIAIAAAAAAAGTAALIFKGLKEKSNSQILEEQNTPQVTAQPQVQPQQPVQNAAPSQQASAPSFSMNNYLNDADKNAKAIA